MTSITASQTPASQSIAMVIDSLNGGGAEKVCLTLADAMVKQGCRVHLILLKNKPFYTINPEIIVHTLFDDIDEHRVNSAYIAKAAKKIDAILERYGPFEKVFAHLEASYLAVKQSQAPHPWFVVHNAVSASLRRALKLGPLKYWRVRKAFAALDKQKIICVSDGVKHDIKRLAWIQPKKILTIYNPVDRALIVQLAQAQQAAIPDVPYLIHVGRFAKQKRHDVLLKALAQLPENLHLVLLCTPSKKLTKLIARSGTADRVTVAGWQSNPYPWIKHASALVLCSDYEGFGMVLAESLACETPVISTDCPYGPNEILIGPLAQFLTRVGCVFDLREKIHSALTNRELFKHAPILDKLSPKSIVEQYLSVDK